MEGKDMT